MRRNSCIRSHDLRWGRKTTKMRNGLEHLVGLCSKAAIGELDWQHVAKATAEWVGGDKAMILLSSPRNAYKSSINFNHDPIAVDRYNSGYNISDPRRQFALATPVGQCRLGQSYIPNEQIKNTAYFADIAIAGDVKDSVHGVILNNEHVRIAISVQRGFKMEYFGTEEAHRLQTILPVLADHFDLSSRIALVSNRHPAQTGAESFLVNREFSVRPLRGGAFRSLNCGNKLCVMPDRILFESGRAKHAVGECVSLALRGEHAKCSIEEHVLRFAPMPENLGFIAESAEVVIMTIGPRHRSVDLQPFARAFELTDREAELLQCLTANPNVRVAAEATQMAYETARWHVKNMCAKCMASSMLELIELAKAGDVSRAT